MRGGCGDDARFAPCTVQRKVFPVADHISHVLKILTRAAFMCVLIRLCFVSSALNNRPLPVQILEGLERIHACHSASTGLAEHRQRRTAETNEGWSPIPATYSYELFIRTLPEPGAY